jgi:hypothetical protein
MTIYEQTRLMIFFSILTARIFVSKIVGTERRVVLVLSLVIQKPAKPLFNLSKR